MILLLFTIALGDHLSPAFMKSNNFFYLGLNVGEVAIIALPLALIVITGEIDLSVASMLGLCGTILADITSHGVPIYLSMAITLVCGALFGLFNGVLVTKVGLPSLAVTIGTLTLYRGIAQIILPNASLGGFPASLTNIGVVPIPHTQVPYSVAIFAFLAIVFAVVLHATPVGRKIFAIGSNQEAAYFAGIRVKRIKLRCSSLGPVLRDRGHPLLAAFRQRALRRRHGTRVERRADRAAGRHLDLRRPRDDPRPGARRLRDRHAARCAHARPHVASGPERRDRGPARGSA